jgi:phospholipid/cholesterol/gamma-HCH transport system substrate-binding protein
VSKPSNPTLIGAFILGAVLLLVAAVLLFGGTELFTQKRLLVSYFPDSVKGLRVGSSVLLAGVRVGYVKSIQLEGRISNNETLETLVQVLMEVQPETFELFSDGTALSEERREQLTTDEFVKAGIRAKLGIDSLVTGQLLVELDFQPEAPAIYRAPRKTYPEIPTIPSDTQQVIERLQDFFAKLTSEVDFPQIAKDIQGIAAGVNELANSPDLRAMLAGGSKLANDDLPRLTKSIEHALAELDGAIDDTRSLITHVDGRVDPLLAELIPTVQHLDAAIAGAEQVLQSTNSQLRQGSALTLEIQATLRDLQSVSRSASLLLDYLEKHPEALLRGKKE